MNPALAFDAATVGYDVPVVSGATLEVAAGEIVGLIGPNGAGKTTLVRSVTGGARLSGGAVRVLGRDASSYSRIELARAVGVLPQATPTAFAFTARRFAEMGRHAHVSRFGDLGARDHAVVDEAMELTDTAHLADKAVDTLSGGDLQRLTLAQALAQEPSVLLLDEPTSHLDLNHRLQVLDVVRGLANGGLAVLAVFHDLDMAARYADRLAVVSSGALGPAAPPADVLTEETLADAFGVRAVIGTDPVTAAVQVLPVVRVGGPKAVRDTRVTVVSGSGTGSALMRRLVLDGFRVRAGALAAGDTDRDVARALGVPFVSLAPYGSMSEADDAAVARACEEADVVVVAATPFARANVGNLRAAAGAGTPIVLVGEISAEWDFTDGEARAVWDRLRGGSARHCDDAREVVRCVEEASRR